MPIITSHVKILQTIKAHTSDINCVEFCGNHLLFTGSSDKTIPVWRWNVGKGFIEEIFSTLLGHKYGVTCVKVSPQGHKLNVYDVSSPACDQLKAKGANVCSTPKDVTKNADFVITMLPNNDIVSNTYEAIVKDGVDSKTIFIDSSTLNVAKSIQKLVTSKGARFVDAPVSGGVPGAEAATLTFMVGGTSAEYEAVKSTLECMGKRITHCGDYGTDMSAAEYKPPFKPNADTFRTSRAAGRHVYKM